MKIIATIFGVLICVTTIFAQDNSQIQKPYLDFIDGDSIKRSVIDTNFGVGTYVEIKTDKVSDKFKEMNPSKHNKFKSNMWDGKKFGLVLESRELVEIDFFKEFGKEPINYIKFTEPIAIETDRDYKLAIYIDRENLILHFKIDSKGVLSLAE